MSTEDQAAMQDPDDREFDSLLRQSLELQSKTSIAAESSPECLDAETLAAWSDGALPRDQARAVESHAAGCARCQAMLAAFARAEPSSVEPLVQPRATETPARSAWTFWQRWKIGWLVPIAATAAALAIWVATPSPPAVEESKDASAPGMSVPTKSAAPVEQPSSAALSDAGKPAPAGAVASAAPSVNLDATAASRGMTVAQSAGTLEKAERADETAPARGADLERARQAASPSAANVESAASDALVKLEARSAAGRPATPPVPVAEAPALTANAAAAPLRSEADRRAAGAAGEAEAFEIPAPDAVHRWRLRRGGFIEYSETAGREWTAAVVPGGSGAVIVTGAAPSGRVCWLVGRRGTVLLTTDGATFRRLAFPEGVDLTMIQAADGRRATVSTADGRTFTTADGGASWAPQP